MCCSKETHRELVWLIVKKAIPNGDKYCRNMASINRNVSLGELMICASARPVNPSQAKSGYRVAVYVFRNHDLVLHAEYVSDCLEPTENITVSRHERGSWEQVVQYIA